MQKKQTIPQQKITRPEKVITFDMRNDDKIRSLARNGYTIAKYFKDIGLRFKRVIPAASDISVRKLFKLLGETDLICLEVDISNKSEEDKLVMIGDIKDSLLLLDNIHLITESPYKYDTSTTVYRFLIKCNVPEKKK